jgi:IS605 OrfB family transposase
MSSIITYQFRIKDSISAKRLNRMADNVNFVWNFCNETAIKAVKYNSKWFSNYDLHKLTSGVGSELNLHSQTVQKICDEYVIRRKQFKKLKLNWRSKKRSLGWIPFKASGIKINKNEIIYCKQILKYWNSRKIDGNIKQGSFSQNSKGQWFINLQCEVLNHFKDKTLELGIDLGCKTQATLSDGRKFERENLTKKYEKRLASSQRANKKKLTHNIHNKIKNIRKDWNHKTANAILVNAKLICIGDASSSKLAKTKLTKSVLDSSWFQLKSFLKYKAIRLGTIIKDVNESWTTRTCSICFERSGPQGLSGLSVREWTCSKCGSIHDRDINAARNILRLGHQTL